MVHVVYVHGFPRSGTTLLGDCLAASPRVGHFGEMNNLWMPERLEDSRRICGCGRPLAECPVWCAVARELATLPAATRRVLQVRSRGDLVRLGLHLVSGSSRGRAAARAYRSVVERLAEVTGAEVAIDSSKTGVHLLLALRSGLLTGVALARRDRRRAVESRWRHRRRARLPRRSLGPLRVRVSRGLDSVRWWTAAALGTALSAGGARLFGLDATVVRLEDLREDLWPTLDRATTRLTLPPIPDHRRRGPDRIQLPTRHTVWGSKSRFENVGEVRIA